MLAAVGNEDEDAGSSTGCVRALSDVLRCVLSLVSWVVSFVVRGGVSELSWLRGQVGYSRGGPLQLQDVWVCLLEAFEEAQEAILNSGHVLFVEVGVVLAGGVWARPQQGHEAGCHHVREDLYGDGPWRGGPLRFRGASLCWGHRVTFHAHCSAWICQVHRVHLTGQYIVLPRPWLRLRMESNVSRDLRSYVAQMWRSSGSSSLVYVSWPGFFGGGM